MPRPIKEGLDYFELDCHFDEKIRLIQAEFGLKGLAVIVLLYKEIYGGQGYYMTWDEDRLLLLLSENGVAGGDKNLIQEIVSACVRRDIFSERLFKEYHILTSSGIQKRYLNAVARRENVNLKKEYLLISVDKNKVNVYINPVSVNINSINVSRNSQRRVEKSREENKDIYCREGTTSDIENKEKEESKKSKRIETAKANKEAAEVINYFNAKTGLKYKTTTKTTVSIIRARLNEGFTIDDCKKVIDIKTEQWLNNPDMAKYLRPETLFKPSHFESYLNECANKPKIRGNMPFNDNPNNSEFYKSAIERIQRQTEEQAASVPNYTDEDLDRMGFK